MGASERWNTWTFLLFWCDLKTFRMILCFHYCGGDFARFSFNGNRWKWSKMKKKKNFFFLFLFWLVFLSAIHQFLLLNCECRNAGMPKCMTFIFLPFFLFLRPTIIINIHTTLDCAHHTSHFINITLANKQLFTSKTHSYVSIHSEYPIIWIQTLVNH